MLVDEIQNKNLLNKLGENNLPESVRMILILNPKQSKGDPLSLPPSFLHVTLTTPYRSTIAITILSHFIAGQKGQSIPEGDFGSDVVRTKPIYFDLTEGKVSVDSEKDKHFEKVCSNMKKALDHCANILETMLLSYMTS